MIESGDEIACLVFVVAEVIPGITPSGEIVPTGAAGCLRIGRDDADAVANDVGPIVNSFGIAFTDEEDDGGGVGNAVIGEAGGPVGVDDVGLVNDGVDVVGEAEGDDVGLETFDDGAGLLAGAAVGLLDFESLAGFLFPGRGEVVVDFLIEFASGVVRDVEDFDGGGWLRRGGFRASGETERG